MSVSCDYIIVLITAVSKKEAQLLAEKLISKKLAACVNTTSVNSLFTWKGKIERAKEILLVVKSRKKLFKKLEALVKRYHSYQVPEIIALPIIAGNKAYLNWINETTM